MKLLFRFLGAWLLVGFVLVFFVAPLYLLAIYPDIPEPFVRFRTTAFPYGVVDAPPSIASFLMRLIGCGAMIFIGLLFAYRWLRDPKAAAAKKRSR